MTTPNESTTKTTRPGYWLRAIEFRKHQLGREYRASLGDKARKGISDEDYATTMATLEKMAVNLGWDEAQASELGQRGLGHDHGHGHDHSHEHGRRFGRGHCKGLRRHDGDRAADQNPTSKAPENGTEA